MPKIIELTGMPAVGKTTLLEKVRSHLNGDCVFFSDVLVLSRHQFLQRVSFISRLLMILILCAALVRRIGDYFSFMKSCFCTVRAMKYSPKLKLYLWGNILLKLGRYEFVRQKLSGGCVIFDEGLSHIPFNLIEYGAGHLPEIGSVYTPLETALSNINLLVLDQGSVDIERRLLNRGHKRIRVADRKDIRRFVEYNKAITDEIIRQSKYYYESVDVLSTASPDLVRQCSTVIKERVNCDRDAATR